VRIRGGRFALGDADKSPGDERDRRAKVNLRDGHGMTAGAAASVQTKAAFMRMRGPRIMSAQSPAFGVMMPLVNMGGGMHGLRLRLKRSALGRRAQEDKRKDTGEKTGPCETPVRSKQFQNSMPWLVLSRVQKTKTLVNANCPRRS
jgi:hypothetical protein